MISFSAYSGRENTPGQHAWKKSISVSISGYGLDSTYAWGEPSGF